MAHNHYLPPSTTLPVPDGAARSGGAGRRPRGRQHGVGHAVDVQRYHALVGAAVGHRPGIAETAALIAVGERGLVTEGLTEVVRGLAVDADRPAGAVVDHKRGLHGTAVDDEASVEEHPRVGGVLVVAGAVPGAVRVHHLPVRGGVGRLATRQYHRHPDQERDQPGKQSAHGTPFVDVLSSSRTVWRRSISVLLVRYQSWPDLRRACSAARSAVRRIASSTPRIELWLSARPVNAPCGLAAARWILAARRWIRRPARPVARSVGCRPGRRLPARWRACLEEATHAETSAPGW